MKLQELKLAFCLLSREIQGLDDGGKNVPASGSAPSVSDEKTGSSAAAQAPALSQPSASIVPPAVTTGGVSQQPHDSGEAKKPGKCLERVNDASCHEDHDSLRQRSGTGPSRAHNKGGARTEDRLLAEATAADAKKALKHLRVELDTEKRSRVAAER